MAIKIYHNPRCSKSRQTLDLLNQHKTNPVIIEYLQQPPSVNELKEMLKLLRLDVRQIIRDKEDLYKELKLDDKSLSENDLLTALNQNPKLIERPIVVHGDKACIGRPPENVLNII